MSCPRNRDCGSRRERKEGCSNTSNCKSTCPGRKKQCPGKNNCPQQNISISTGTPSREENQCIEPCTWTKPRGIKVSSCARSAGCPIIIQAPTDSKGLQTDVKIELYIHQLQQGQNNSQTAAQIDVLTSGQGSNDSDECRRRSNGKRSSAVETSQQSASDQPSEKSRIFEDKSPSSDVTEGEEKRNTAPSEDFGGLHRRVSDDEVNSSKSSQQNGTEEYYEKPRKNYDVAPGFNNTQTKTIEISAPSSNLAESRTRSDDNGSSEGGGSQQNETDQASKGSNSGEIPNSDDREEENNEKIFNLGVLTDVSPDIQKSIDQNNVIMKESIAGGKSGQLEREEPPQTANPIKGPGSDVGPNIAGKVNMSTNTEENGNQTGRYFSGKDMVDESTQVYINV